MRDALGQGAVAAAQRDRQVGRRHQADGDRLAVAEGVLETSSRVWPKVWPRLKCGVAALLEGVFLHHVDSDANGIGDQLQQARRACLL